MLIDKSYFTGELILHNVHKTGSPENILLNEFISTREPEFLEKLLGYECYTAFIAGITTMEEKWLALLNGAVYSESGRQKRWRGIVSTPGTVLDVDSLISSPFMVTVDGTGEYDPEAGQPQISIPEGLQNQPFDVEQRGYGLLKEGEDYAITDNGTKLSMLNGVVLTSGGKFFFRFNSLALTTASGTAKSSMIANYVYYWYQRNNYTQTAAMSEVKVQSDNAFMTNPGHKMARAWNQMAGWVKEMWCFIENSEYDYPVDAQQQCDSLFDFAPINIFNI